VIDCPVKGDVPWWSLIDFRDMGFLLP